MVRRRGVVVRLHLEQAVRVLVGSGHLRSLSLLLEIVGVFDAVVMVAFEAAVEVRANDIFQVVRLQRRRFLFGSYWHLAHLHSGAALRNSTHVLFALHSNLVSELHLLTQICVKALQKDVIQIALLGASLVVDVLVLIKRRHHFYRTFRFFLLTFLPLGLSFPTARLFSFSYIIVSRIAISSVFGALFLYGCISSQWKALKVAPIANTLLSGELLLFERQSVNFQRDLDAVTDMSMVQIPKIDFILRHVI